MKDSQILSLWDIEKVKKKKKKALFKKITEKFIYRLYDCTLLPSLAYKLPIFLFLLFFFFNYGYTKEITWKGVKMIPLQLMGFIGVPIQKYNELLSNGAMVRIACMFSLVSWIYIYKIILYRWI